MPSPNAPSDYDRLIPAEVKDDAFYQAILSISRSEQLQNVLEIGSSSGEGSTEAFVLGLRENPNKPTLFCMEVSSPRFEALRTRYAGDRLVRPYRASSVPAERLPSEDEVARFYNAHLAGRFFPLQEVLRWLRQDVEYIRSSGVPTEGIKLIKQENGIELFDLVLIDGSEFAGIAELEEVYGAGFILLDDTNTFKNFANFQRLINDPAYVLTDHRPDVRNGFAIFKRKDVRPRSYSTIQAAVERIEGFMVPGQEQYLFEKVASLPDDAVILEIGSFKGRSTVAMAFACIGTTRRLYCADTWDGNDKDFPERKFFETWKNNIIRNRVESVIQPFRGTSHDVLRDWHSLTGGQPIDFVFIDGSHEYGDVLKDLQLVWPFVKDLGWVAFHDVHHTWPGPLEVWTDVGMRSLVNHEYSSTLACGQKPPGGVLAAPRGRPATRPGARLPVHFFTIVLNGLPYLRHHIEQFRQLDFDWHWHVIEGVAELKHDTAWSVASGGKIPPAFHSDGRSVDGTGEYLDELARAYPDRVTIYRKPPGQLWDGKLEMVSAPLNAIVEDCLLWQVDVDELWTAQQFAAGRKLFLDHPAKTAALYWCWFFAGPELVISTRNCYAHNPQNEWLRTWRFRPGMRWAAHEPPILAEPLPDGQWRSVASVDPFLHGQTEAAGLVFQHYAYATEGQVRFKQDYYGYPGAVERWRALQAATDYPVALRHYFPWVQDHTQVDRADKYVAGKLIDLQSFRPSSTAAGSELAGRPLAATTPPNAVPPRIVIDGVFFQIINTGIARVWRTLLKEWSDSGFAANLVVVDRGGTAPRIRGVRYVDAPLFDFRNLATDRQMLQSICDQHQAAAFISTYYTMPVRTPSLMLVYDMIPELLGYDLKDLWWQSKHECVRRAVAHMTISHSTANDLCRLFPTLNRASIVVAHCGVDSTFKPATPEAIAAFREKYGIRRPYFLMVGMRGGYKGGATFLEAFAQLANRQEFEIICTGGVSELEPDLAAPASAHHIPIRLLQLPDGDDMCAVYAGATALVYPSAYEGFGLPVLEAMACGCPVITCRASSIPEVGGEAVIYLEHGDAKALTMALRQVQDPLVRQRLIKTGLERARLFSWKGMAEIVAGTISAAVAQIRQASQPTGAVSPPPQILSTLASSGVTVSFGSQTSSVIPAQVPYVDSLRELLVQFQNRPQDPNLFARLCGERRMLAARLLEVAPSQLGGFHGSDVGQAHQLLRSSGFFQFPVPSEDGGLVQNLAQRLVDPAAINVLLAAMLFRPAHRWSLPVSLDASPDWFVQEHLLYVLACPPLFCESGEAAAYAEYLQRWFEYLHTALAPDTPRTRELLNVFVQACNCVGAYFNNANLRSLYTHRAELISLGLRRFGHRLDHTFSARRAGSKIRLGIFNAHWTPATETYATLPLFEHLDRSSFEVTLFSLSATGVPLEQYCRSRADHFVVLPEPLDQQVQTLRQHDLDVLFFGTNLTAVSHALTLIAMHRLARVQITSICSPATTGMPMIDCFLAGTLTEPKPDAQTQYREKLCLIEGPGLCFNYGGKPGPTGANVTRAALGLNDQQVVFASGANFFKIIPELRDTWARILAAVPDAVLLLYPFGPAWSNSYAAVPFIDAFHEALKRHGVAPNRVQFLRPLPTSSDIAQFLAQCDIYLDSFPYAGATSLLDPLSVGLPPVAMTGDCLRLAQATAVLTDLGLTQLVAADVETYIALAVSLARDPAGRQTLRKAILDRVEASPPPRLLDSQWFSGQCGDLFKSLLHERGIC